ncbi:MAG: hypothetical protein H0X71_08365 [Rubrobacter sp.]|nr:hypothetical protein [Rubrobacter sp.]
MYKDKVRKKQTRAQLAKELKRDDIPDPVWNNLESRGLVRDFRADQYGWEELVYDAQVQLDTYRETLKESGAGDDTNGETGDEGSKTVEPELEAREQARAEALGEYVAFRASMHPHVRYFRKVVLGGKLLKPESAYAFVRSPANQCFAVAWFVKQRVSMRKHHSYTYRDGWAIDEDGNECRFDDVYVEPPGKVFRKVTYDSYDFRFKDTLSFPLRGDFIHDVDKIPVEAGSVLDTLRKVSVHLVEAFGNAWNEAQAAQFMLTGEATPVVALAGRIESSDGDEMTHGTISLTVDPWVSAKTVLRYYRKMQKVMLEYKDNRPLSEKGLALFRFVVGQMRDSVPGIERLKSEALFSEDGEVNVVSSEEELREPRLTGRPSWRMCQERWNQSCPNPKWHYGDVRNFRRDFRRAARLLLVPPYGDSAELLFVDTKHTLPEDS